MAQQSLQRELQEALRVQHELDQVGRRGVLVVFVAFVRYMCLCQWISWLFTVHPRECIHMHVRFSQSLHAEMQRSEETRVYVTVLERALELRASELGLVRVF
jgi:hypothetical protein